MRSLLFVLLIAACAPATRPGTVNVAMVRSEINGTIRGSDNDRTIHSMGKVSADRAVVYTTTKDGATKQEEVWVRNGDAWQKESATTLSASTAN
jgi:hypothetical protein